MVPSSVRLRFITAAVAMQIDVCLVNVRGSLQAQQRRRQLMTLQADYWLSSTRDKAFLKPPALFTVTISCQWLVIGHSDLETMVPFQADFTKTNLRCQTQCTHPQPSAPCRHAASLAASQWQAKTKNHNCKNHFFNVSYVSFGRLDQARRLKQSRKMHEVQV